MTDQNKKKQALTDKERLDRRNFEIRMDNAFGCIGTFLLAILLFMIVTR
jgi:hypothetical protein